MAMTLSQSLNIMVFSNWKLVRTSIVICMFRCGKLMLWQNNFTDGKVRKLNYIIHNPNTAEETAKVLLEICIQANEGKVERKLREFTEYDEGINVLNEKNAEVAEGV